MSNDVTERAASNSLSTPSPNEHAQGIFPTSLAAASVGRHPNIKAQSSKRTRSAFWRSQRWTELGFRVAAPHKSSPRFSQCFSTDAAHGYVTVTKRMKNSVYLAPVARKWRRYITSRGQHIPRTTLERNSSASRKIMQSVSRRLSPQHSVWRRRTNGGQTDHNSGLVNRLVALCFRAVTDHQPQLCNTSSFQAYTHESADIYYFSSTDENWNLLHFAITPSSRPMIYKQCRAEL